VLEDHSPRSKQVLLIAHLQAVNSGAAVIDVDCLLQALVLEDQGTGEWANLLGPPELGAGEREFKIPSPPEPFFTSDEAQQLLTKMRGPSPPLQLLPASRDIPMSPDVSHALLVASDLRKKFHADKVEPLHLLAAALQERSEGSDRIFREHGITHEKILQALATEE
jgi:hypothetical protein